ncbi:MAG TPA: CPBP family intramembrane glutamic endopeptidase [Acidisarcina sp.]
MLGHWPLDMQGWKRDVVAAFSTWMLFVPVLFVIGGTLSHFEKPGVNGSAEQRLAQEGKTRARGSTAKAIDSAGTQQAQSKLSLRLPSPHAARKAIVKLAPQSVGEMLLWILLSISAGICEELVFRGYLQQQFTSVRVAKGGLWVGVALSAVIFGSAHAYEGVVGIISITAFGAVLSLLAVRRSNLRAGMMMHAWHDIFAGMVLFLLKHAHAI